MRRALIASLGCAAAAPLLAQTPPDTVPAAKTAPPAEEAPAPGPSTRPAAPHADAASGASNAPPPQTVPGTAPARNPFGTTEQIERAARGRTQDDGRAAGGHAQVPPLPALTLRGYAQGADPENTDGPVALIAIEGLGTLPLRTGQTLTLPGGDAAFTLEVVEMNHRRVILERHPHTQRIILR